MDPLTILGLVSSGIGLTSQIVDMFGAKGENERIRNLERKRKGFADAVASSTRRQSGDMVRSNFPINGIINGINTPLFAELGLTNPMAQTAPGAMPVVAEGKEHITSPESQGQTIKGNSHEQGGELVALKPGETIFSNDLKIGEEIAGFLSSLGIPAKPTDTYAKASKSIDNKKKKLAPDSPDRRRSNTNKLTEDRLAKATEVLAAAQAEQAPESQAQAGIPMAKDGFTWEGLLGDGPVGKSSDGNKPQFKLNNWLKALDWNSIGAGVSQALPAVTGIMDFFNKRSAINKMEGPVNPPMQLMAKLDKSLDMRDYFSALQRNQALGRESAKGFSGAQQRVGASAMADANYARGVNEMTREKNNHRTATSNREMEINSGIAAQNLGMLYDYQNRNVDHNNNKVAAKSNAQTDFYTFIQQLLRDNKLGQADKDKIDMIMKGFDPNVVNAIFKR
jgi:hypothetical protein